MNGPAPGLVSDWLTAPFVWTVVGAFVLAWIGIWVGKIIREDRINHTFDTWQVEPYCVAFGHSWVLAENDTVYVCLCGERVVRDAQVYDQDGAA